MATLWNKRTLPSPPTLTYAAPKNANTTLFLAHMSSAMSTLQQTSALSDEYAVLDRLIYKFNNQLRKEKVIQTMKMIKQSLKRVAELDMKAEFEKFYDSKQRTDGLKIYLPSKQMLQYLLVRLMGYAKLLIRSGQCCQEAYIYCMQKLGRGDLVRQMLLFASVTSRIWVLSQALGLHAINWYNDLYGYLEILEGAQVEWLPPKESLPPDLHDWLEIGNDLSEPKVHTRVYNLGLSDKSTVDLDDLLSKFSEEPNPSPASTGGDETREEQDLDEPQTEDETSLLSHQTMEPLDADRIANMDLDDCIDNLYSYGQQEDIGVSVTIDRSEFSQKKVSTPAQDVDSKESARTLSTRAPGVMVTQQASKEQSTVLTAGLGKWANLTQSQQKKQERRAIKDLARKLVFEQGVTECNDSMDPLLQKFVQLSLISFAQKSARKLVRQDGVCEVDSSMGETLKGFVEMEIKRKPQRIEKKQRERQRQAASRAAKAAVGKNASDVQAQILGSSVASKKEDTKTLSDKELQAIGQQLNLMETKTKQGRKKRRTRARKKRKLENLGMNEPSEMGGGKQADKSKQTTSQMSSTAFGASSSQSSVKESESLSLAKQHKLARVADQVHFAERPAKKLKAGHNEGQGNSKPVKTSQSVGKGPGRLSAEQRDILAALTASVKKHKK